MSVQVEDAFSFSPNVLTLSFHHHAPGYFPNSGGKLASGGGRGRGYAMNVPLPHGIGDDDYLAVFHKVVQTARETFQPDAVVMVCGADSLAADPLGAFALSYRSYVESVLAVRKWGLPLLLLGGGGYREPDTARCWAHVMAAACGVLSTLKRDIPDHPFFPKYGPSFRMDETTKANRRRVVPMDPRVRERVVQDACDHLTQNIKPKPAPKRGVRRATSARQHAKVQPMPRQEQHAVAPNASTLDTGCNSKANGDPHNVNPVAVSARTPCESLPLAACASGHGRDNSM